MSNQTTHITITPKLSTAIAAASAPPAPNVTPKPGFFAVNYFPSAAGGYGMWTNYSATTVRADMAKIAAYGFNGIRVQIAGKTGAFDLSGPTTNQLNNLKDFYVAAQNAGLKLQLAFFDFVGSPYGLIAECQAWLASIIGALKAQDSTLSQIKYFEIKNEAMSGANYNQAYSSGFDSGWPAGVTQGTIVWNESGGVILTWIQYMTYKLRALAPAIPVTLSFPNAQYKANNGSNNGSDGLGVYYSFAHGTDWEPDFYSYHCYSNGSLSLAQTELNGALATIGGNPAKLNIGEFGFDVEGTTITTAQRNTAATYAQTVRGDCQTLGLGEPTWWMFYDLTTSSFEFPTGQCDGLVDVNGVDTAAGTVYRNFPPGTFA